MTTSRKTHLIRTESEQAVVTLCGRTIPYATDDQGRFLLGHATRDLGENECRACMNVMLSTLNSISRS